MTKKIAIIIGGGPAGLTAAYEFLEKTDIQPIVIEMGSFWGGISRTEEQNGNRIDIGGHRFFSKSDEVMQWWQNILPIYSENKELNITYRNQDKKIDISKNKAVSETSDKVLLVRKRKSRIYFNKNFYDYPISLNFKTLYNLGILNSILIGFSYIKSALFPIRNPKSLEQFFINRFGTRLYKTFFKDYTEKVWGVPCTEISAEWGAQRIKGLSITKSIWNAVKKHLNLNKQSISQKDTETSLIEYFLYPKYGPGQMWETVAEKILEKGGILKQNCKVVKINFIDNQVKSVETINTTTGFEEVIELDYCISTMPVNELVNALNYSIPNDVKRVSDGLMYRDFITVGLLLDTINYELKDNWIYIQENYVKVGRLQIFNNWSPFMVKDNSKTWVGLEYFCNTTDDLWHKTNEELTALAITEMIQLGFINSPKSVTDTKVIKVPKAYPAYFGTYSEFEIIKNFTDNIDNLYLIGRNGMHKYNNQDHSMLTAIKTVENIKNNISSKENIWAIIPKKNIMRRANDFITKNFNFLIVILLFTIFLFFRLSSKIYFLADSYEYIETAKQINNLTFLDTKRPFFYPLFLLISIYTNPIFTIIIQTIIGILTFYIFIKILKFHKIEVKKKYLWFLIFTPSIFMYTQLIMSEWIVCFFITILLWLISQSWSTKNFVYIQIITILLAFTKPIFYPFIYINFLFFTFYFVKNKVFSFWLFMPIIILQLYLVFNESRTGYRHFSSIENSNLINYNLYYFKSSTISKEKADLWLQSVYTKSYENKNYREQNEYLKKIAQNEIKQNLFKYSYYHLLTSLRGCFDPGRFDLMTFFKKEDGKQGLLEILNTDKSLFSLLKNKFALVYFFLIPVFIFNIIKWFYFSKFIFQNRLSYLGYYILLLLIYYILISGPVNCSRYMMPLQVIVFFFAVQGFVVKKNKLKNKIFN